MTLDTRPAAALQRAGLPTVQTMVRRILSTLGEATPSDIESGLSWYADAGAHATAVGAMAGGGAEMGAAIIAHLSPRVFWSRNLVAAYALAAGQAKPSGIMGASWSRAETATGAISPMGTLKGPKVSAFARNMLGDAEAVTIDVWALRVAVGAELAGDGTILGRAGVYDAVVHAYRVAARRAGLEPMSLQAIVWIVARNGRAG